MLAELVPDWMRQRVEQGLARHDWIEFPQDFLDSVPQQGPPCEFCRTPTQKILIPHSMRPYPKGLIITTAEMPAYQCPGTAEPCSAVPVSERPTALYLDNASTVKMLGYIRELLSVTGDLEGVSYVEEVMRVSTTPNEG